MRQILFESFTDEAIEFLFQQVCVEGWSLTCTVNKVKGGMPEYRKLMKEDNRLQYIYEFYKNKVRYRYGHANIR